MDIKIATAADMASSGISSRNPLLGAAESLAFLAPLIVITDMARQRAVYDLVVRESFPLELKLQRCTRVLNAIALPDHRERFQMWDCKQRLLRDINEVEGVIRLLRREVAIRGVVRLLLLLHCLWADLVYLSSLPEFVLVLNNSSASAELSRTYPGNQAFSVIEEMNGVIDCIYCGIIRELEQARPRLATTTNKNQYRTPSGSPASC
jgi:hypothetical protein